jgi:hypothetical protein
MEKQELANEALCHHLCGVGLPASLAGDRVRLGIKDLSIRCLVLAAKDHGYTHAVLLGLELFLSRDHSHSIRETVVGLGQTPAEAMLQAVHVWMEGVFPPIRALYQPGSGAPDVRRFALVTHTLQTERSTHWEVIAGPVQAGGEHSDALFVQLDTSPLFLFIQEPLAEVLSADRLQWLKIFLCRQMDSTVQGECKLNNDDWPAGLEVLSGFPWPAVPGFLSLRQFIILRPASRSI